MMSASTFAGQRVLVTGGAGFVGSHIADALLAQGARVTIFDNLSTGFPEFVSPSATFVHGDLLDRTQIESACAGHDFVFHFAANADVREGLSHPRRDVEQNLLATQNVLEAMRLHGIKRIAFSSTGAIYGDSAILPTPEAAPFPIQTSLYGASKVACEGLLTAYAFGYGFEVWLFRFVSLLGPRYTHGHVFDFWRKLRADSTRLSILGNGEQKKSYIHVADCVAGIFAAIERAQEPINIFNIGHEQWLEVNQSVRIICRELGLTPKLSYTGGERGWIGDAPKLLLDTAKLRALGWAPTRDIESSIVETVQFLERNPFCARRC
ncbi:MAG TPA: NAD-dependent epimerase/dehydratase family protein [Polyangiaceae bacterium]|jgi:UDP-glucose 4-epimerase|nr:NAD-dependent epimerase/dehydratase family protein [Polyangiaceae bacterium]